jgi:hypothetical protein
MGEGRGEGPPNGPDYLRINNALLTPGGVAERVIEHFALPRFTGANPT